MYHHTAAAGEIRMTQGNILNILVRYTVPVFLSQILQQFYNVIDGVIIGHYVGAEALAATGTAGLLLSVIVNFFIGISTGISVMTSRLFGGEYYEKLKETVVTAVFLCIIAGIILTGAGVCSAPLLLKALHTPPEVQDLAKKYLVICFWGMVPQLLYNIGTAILRSLGNTKTPLWYLGSSVLLNLILDLILVAVFHMGIEGAACATAFSQWVLALCVLWKLSRLDSRYCFRWSIPGGSVKVGGEMFRLGIPSGMQAVFMSISSLILQSSINSFGSAAMAGMTVFSKIEGFLYYPAFSFGMAVTGFVGQNLGAGKHDRIRKGMKISMGVVAGGTLLLSMLGLCFAEPLLKCFTADPQVLCNGREAVICIFPFYWLYGVNQVYIGGIRGLGKTGYPMTASLISYCIFRVAWCGLLLPVCFDMRIIYASYDVSWILMLMILAVGYHRYRF
ncbi:MAG: MATE family efflux transporter [Ruminococcus sp.]|jgi:putative MATE family efflux protein